MFTWLKKRSERQAQEAAARSEFRNKQFEIYRTEFAEWHGKVERANGKAENAAERGDGNSALAWLKIAEELQKQKPAYPYDWHSY